MKTSRRRVVLQFEQKNPSPKTSRGGGAAS